MDSALGPVTVLFVSGLQEHVWSDDVLFNWERPDPPWPATELVERLWLGGTPRTDVVVSPGCVASPWRPSAHAGHVDACLTMTPIAGPAGDGVVELRVPLKDRDDETLNLGLLRETIDWVVARHRRGDRVLVRCHAGLNRSGLVAVPALTWIDEDLSFDSALALARSRRHPTVLCRPHFAVAARALSRPGA